jgi:hypothetical protein
MGLGNHDPFGLAPSAGDGHHPITDGTSACRVRPQFQDVPGELQARNVSRRPGRSRVEPTPLQQIGAIDACSGHSDHHLPGARDGIRAFGDDQFSSNDGDGTHVSTVPVGPWSPFGCRSDHGVVMLGGDPDFTKLRP